jgi:hypothetical protein
MGCSGEDIQLSPAARSKFPYSVECKKLKTFSVYKHFDQAKTNAGAWTPMLVIEGDRREALVVMRLDDFLAEKASEGATGKVRD